VGQAEVPPVVPCLFLLVPATRQLGVQQLSVVVTAHLPPLVAACLCPVVLLRLVPAVLLLSTVAEVLMRLVMSWWRPQTAARLA
jgi:hypothetical protein